MTKRRVSMADEVEFPNKTKQFLDLVTNNSSFEQLTSDQSLPIAKIHLSARQPRRYFSAQAMESLVESIREHGILQPLLIRPLEADNYELIAGERRYRAATILGIEEVPVIIRRFTDLEAMQVALLENLQREDLNPIEETEAVLQLLSIHLECDSSEVVSLLNHIAHLQKHKMEFTNNVVRNQWEMIKQIFTVVGKLTPDSFRSHRLPLLNLPPDILEHLREGKIEYTKARAIAQLKDNEQRKKLLHVAIDENLSLTEIKRKIAELKTAEGTQTSKENKLTYPQRLKDISAKAKKIKPWDDPNKQQEFEALLEKLEALL